MYSLKQLVISGRKRRWILMDLETSLPLLYPLRYHIDHLAFRSLSTQSASLQSVKFFYEFWRQKYGVSFCYSFYSSDHNPDIAVGEMPAFWMYLENGHNVQSNVLSLTRVTKANSLTHTVRVRAVIHFISFLINTYISPAYRVTLPKHYHFWLRVYTPVYSFAGRIIERLHQTNFRNIVTAAKDFRVCLGQWCSACME